MDLEDDLKVIKAVGKGSCRLQDMPLRRFGVDLVNEVN